MKPEYAEIESGIVHLVREAAADWDLDLDALSGDTALVSELSFSSVDVVHLLASVEMRFGRKLGYEQLLVKNGTYRTELSIGELSRFVYEEYDRGGVGPASAAPPERA